MKSLLLISLIIAFSANTFASEKIDFNHLIKENNKNKKELVNKLYEQVHDTQFEESAKTEKDQTPVINGGPGETLIVPTSSFKGTTRKARSASTRIDKTQIEKEIMANEIKN